MYLYCKKKYIDDDIKYFPIGKLEVKGDDIIIEGYSLIMACERVLYKKINDNYIIPKKPQDIIELLHYFTYNEYTELVNEKEIPTSDRTLHSNMPKMIFNTRTFSMQKEKV